MYLFVPSGIRAKWSYLDRLEENGRKKKKKDIQKEAKKSEWENINILLQGKMYVLHLPMLIIISWK